MRRGYHVTERALLESILRDGLIAQVSDKASNSPRLERAAVYVFGRRKAACEFASDNLWPDPVLLGVHMAAYSVIADPEYDEGVSWAVECSIRAEDIYIARWPQR